MMSQVTVLFFANLRERAGKKKIQMDVPGETSVAQFKELLINELPDLAPAFESIIISINKEFAFDDEIIPDEAEIALFPPVSGGSQTKSGNNRPSYFSIQEEEIDLNELIKVITTDTSGAVCIFTGIVRGTTLRGDPFDTVYLEYEAYQEMAENKMYQVAQEIWERWADVAGIAIVQRIGRLFVGTPTVLIACSAPHRDSGAFEAARYGIDRLKEIVPIWKMESGPDGEKWIEGDYYPKAGE
jgi:molybdopterin synthase catalytic subunit